MICNNCGANIGDGQSFCENCGSPVQQAPQQVQQPAYQQPVAQQPQQPVQQYQQQLQPNGAASAESLAMKAMIFGIVTMGCVVVLAWIPYIKGLAAIAGVVFAILALSFTSKARALGSRNIKDKLGKIFGVIGLILNIVLLFINMTGWLLGFINTHILH